MISDSDIAPSGITFDNFHLSKAIPTRSATGASASNLLSACADSKVLAFVAAATSVNTHRAYESDLAHYLSWGGCIPSAPQLVAQYLATHAESLSMATLARRIVSIRRAHVFGGFPDPTKAELVRLALRGVRRLHGRPQRRVAPLRLEHLGDIVSRLGSEKRDLRDRALLLVGFAGAFRRSELTAIDCSQIERRERGIIITLPRSKTDQEGRGRQVAIVRVGGPICPVAALDGWLTTSGITDGPLFRPVSKAGRVLGKPLSTSAVAIIVKQRAAQVGLDPQRYSGHSPRAGFVTSAAAAGLPVWKIKGQTGHASDAVVGRYIREVDAFETMIPIWS